MDFFRQRVNQWLGILLLASMAFWTTLYYFSNKAQAIGDSHVEDYSEYL